MSKGRILWMAFSALVALVVGYFVPVLDASSVGTRPPAMTSLPVSAFLRAVESAASGVELAASEHLANFSFNWTSGNVAGLLRTVASEKAWAASLGVGPIAWSLQPFKVGGPSHWLGRDTEHLIDFQLIGPSDDLTTENLTIFPGPHRASTDQVLAVYALAARYGGIHAGTWARNSLASAIHNGSFVHTDVTKTFGAFRIELLTMAGSLSLGYEQVTRA